MIRIPSKWATLDYWGSPEWEIVCGKLKELDQRGVVWNPGPAHMFANLDALDLSRIKVVIVGQDPYPNPVWACGHAFSIPPHAVGLPPSLAMMVKELQFDVPEFTFQNGSLLPWVKQGVLLWSPIPTCTAWRSLSHNWPEYERLTAEIFGRCELKVFAFLGSAAKRYIKYVNEDNNIVLWTSHPSPRGAVRGVNPFFGSRIFSTINMHLEELKLGRIDWRL